MCVVGEWLFSARVAGAAPASNPFGGNSSVPSNTSSFGGMSQASAPAFGQSSGFGSSAPFAASGNAKQSNPFSSGGATTTSFGRSSGFGAPGGSFGAPSAPTTAFGVSAPSSGTQPNNRNDRKAASTFGNRARNLSADALSGVASSTAFGNQKVGGFGGGFNGGAPPLPPSDDGFGFGSAPKPLGASTTFGQPLVRSKRPPRDPLPPSTTTFGNPSSGFGSSATASPVPSPPSTAFGSQSGGVRVRKKTPGPLGGDPSNGDNPFGFGGNGAGGQHANQTAFGQPNRTSAGPAVTATTFGREKIKSSANPFGGQGASTDPFGGAPSLEARMGGGPKKSFVKNKRMQLNSTNGEQDAASMTSSKKFPPSSNSKSFLEGSDTDAGPFVPKRNPAMGGAQVQQPSMRKKPQRPSASESATAPAPVDFSSNDDSNKAELSSAVNLDGTCIDMCSPAERELHIRVDELSGFEKCFPDQPGRERELIIKRFQRSSADHKLDIPSEVRPPGVLRRTQLYIEQEIMDRERAGVDPRLNPPRVPEIIELYNFCWDRFRMIRKDFVLQNYRGAGGRVHPIALDVHERVARYHILSEHELIEVPSFVAQQNMEQLGQTLKSLNELYDESRNVGDPSYLSPFEAEFRAYFILCTLDNGRGLDVLKFVKGLHKSIVDSPQVKFAMKVFVARHTSDYFQFFMLLRQATYLQSCLLFRYLPGIRSTALQRMNRAFRNQPYPLVDLMNLLCFDDIDHAGSVCSQHGLVITQQDEDDDGSLMVQFGGEFETEIQLRKNKRPLEVRGSQVYVGQKQGDYLRKDICRGVTEYYPDEYPALSHLIQDLEYKERAKLYPSHPVCEDKYSYFADYSSHTSRESYTPAQTPTPSQSGFAGVRNEQVAERDNKMHDLEAIAKRKAELERNQQMVMQRIAQLQREKEEKARAEQERKAATDATAHHDVSAEAEANAREKEAEALRMQQELENRLREQEKQRRLQKQRELEAFEKQKREAAEAAAREREAASRRQEALKAKAAEEQRRREAELREEEARRKAAEERERQRRQQLAEEQARLRREAALEAKRQEELARERAEKKRKLRIKKQMQAMLRLRFHVWKKYVKASKSMPAPVKMDASRFVGGVVHFKPKSTIQWLFKDENAASTMGTRLRNPSELLKVASDPVKTVPDSWGSLDVLSIVGAQLRAHRSDSSAIGWKLLVGDLLDAPTSSFGVWCASKLGISVTGSSSYRVFSSEAEDVAICCRYIDAAFMRDFSCEHHNAHILGTSALLLPLAFSEVQDSGKRQRWLQHVEKLFSIVPRRSQVSVLVFENTDPSPAARHVLGVLETSIRHSLAKFAPLVHADFAFVSGSGKEYTPPLIDELKQALVSLSERWVAPPKLVSLGVRELLESGISAAMKRSTSSSMSVQKEARRVVRNIRDDLQSQRVADEDYPPTELQSILAVPEYGCNMDQKWFEFEAVVSILESVKVEPETQLLLERQEVCNRYFTKIASFIDQIFASSTRASAEVSTFELKKLVYNQLIPIHEALMVDDESRLVSTETASAMLPWKKIFQEIYGAFLESLEDLSVAVPATWRPQRALDLLEVVHDPIDDRASTESSKAESMPTDIKAKQVDRAHAASARATISLKSLKRSFGGVAGSSTGRLQPAQGLENQRNGLRRSRKEDTRIKRLRQEIARERTASAKFQQLLRQEVNRWAL